MAKEAISTGRARACAPTAAVLLDVLGTLVRLEPPGPRLRAELWRVAGVEVSEVAAVDAFRAEIDYYLAHHLEGRDQVGLDGLRDRCAAVIAERLSAAEAVKLDPAPVREAMLAALRFTPYPDAAPALQNLRDRGLRLVAVSNWDCSLAAVLDRAGLTPLLDGAVSSAEVGAAKPDPAPLRAALEVAGVSPEAAVYVGDSVEHDVAAARAADVRAVLLRRDPSGQDAAGAPTIQGLDELSSVT